MTQRWKVSRFPLVVVSLAAGMGVAAQEMRMTVRPLFEGLRASAAPFPLRVTLDNPGPHAQGVVRVQAQGGETLVPVDLPQGSRKAVTVIANLQLGQTTVLFDSNRGRLKRFYENPPGTIESPNAIGLVTDTPGLMGFLREKSAERNPAAFVGDTYVTAEDLPDREIGLDSLASLLLGEGAERLTGAQVSAVTAWVVGGGSLVFMGGASTPVLADPRWGRLLPTTPGTATTVAASLVAPFSASPPPPGVVTVTANRPKPGARTKFRTDAGPLLCEWRVGLGKVVFLSFNLFESPLTGWQGRREALLEAADPYQRNSMRSAFGLDQLRDNPVFATSTLPSGAPPPRTTASPFLSDADPFQTRLPDAGQVILILSAYFVLVVPVSFVGLRKMGRGELAWITAPLLSLLFAGILFYTARELYRAGLSRKVSGVLLAAQGVPGARVYGTAQLFFPTGGSYDLSFAHADWIAAAQESNYGMPTADCTVLDEGEMRVPNLGVPNLSFRQFEFRQAVETGELLELRLVPARFRNSRDRYRGYVRNTSSLTLDHPVLYQGRVSIPLGASLAPGEEHAIDLDPTTVQELPQPERFTASDPTVVFVSANVATSKFGPQIGNQSASDVRLVFVGRTTESGS